MGQGFGLLNTMGALLLFRKMGKYPAEWPEQNKNNQGLLGTNVNDYDDLIMKTPRVFKIRAKVWLYEGMAGWHFVTLPKVMSQRIRRDFELLSGGWGSLPVSITLGKTRWNTSIFPDKKSGSYVLPLKAEVRKAEKIVAGKMVTFRLKIRSC